MPRVGVTALFSIAVAILGLAGCGQRVATPATPPAIPAPPRPEPGPGPGPGLRPEQPRGELPTGVRLVGRDGVVRIDLEDYVRGTVEAETWLPRQESRAVAQSVFELQALIARTYVVANLGRHRGQGADVCDTTHCQLFRPRSAAHAHEAAMDAALRRSSGRVLLFEGRPILALFHAACGGATSAADAVWGGTPRPYLQSVSDGFCARAAPWQARLSREAVARALDADPRTRVDGRLDAIEILSRDAGDRAALVALTGRRSPVVRGDELRAALARAFGARTVRSARFRVRRDGEIFVLDGTGFGHGAGLCQAGALALLRDGRTVAEVVAHYYPGVTAVGWPGVLTRLEMRQQVGEAFDHE